MPKQTISDPSNSSKGIEFKQDDWVRLKNDPQRIGAFQGTEQRGGRVVALVRFPSGVRQIPLGQIERCPTTAEEPLDFLRAGNFSEPERLRQVLAHIRLTGQLSDMIYSMEATNTDFYAHQFKPVVKMLGSPTGSLLVADEVGLGKTIEAGLIWTELKARFDYRRLLIVCPKVLVPKWTSELDQKFSIDAHPAMADDLLAKLDSRSERRADRTFALVCGMQSLRPPRKWYDDASKNYGRASARLARLLDEKATDVDEPIFDLVVVDEAHHMRNAGTQTNRLARLLQPVTRHLLFLTATPINLRDEDLFSLLNLIDPSNYTDVSVLRDIIEANAPIMRARDHLLRGGALEEIVEDLQMASAQPLLLGNRQLSALQKEVSQPSKVDPVARRVEVASRLESVNLLANTVNRTRRRDVEEFRVIRRPIIRRAVMSTEEHKVYDDVTRAIQEFSLSRDVSAAFLATMPQRMLASCIPAAIEYWRKQGSFGEVVDDLDEEIDRKEANDIADERPLIAAILPATRRAPAREVLESVDTKYRELQKWLLELKKESPDEKVILFSTFRPTLAYLERRLREDEFKSVTIKGGDKDRSEIIERFRLDDVPILLASEVGSEGIDLQFARIVVNYDMPWNPMKVEQRIGRIDRLGQTSDTVSIINFLTDDTVDARIYDRLYARLGLCERALGGFEEIIGRHISSLTPDIVSGRLTRDELDERLRQAASALEQIKITEAEMETEAAALVAHGDHVVRSIHAARGLHRWIGHSDLAEYIETALASLHPGCELIEREEEGLYDISLTAEARAAAADFCDRMKLPKGRLFSGVARVRCRLARPADRSVRRGRAIETVTQTHPLVRYLANRVADTEAPNLRPAVAARVRRSALRTLAPAPEPGRYLIAAEYWRFGGALPQERIAYAGFSLQDEKAIDNDAAEALLLAAASEGSLWPNADVQVDLETCVDLAAEVLFDALAERHVEEDEAINAQKQDRASIQLKSLSLLTERQVRTIQEVLDAQRRRFSSGRDDSGKIQKIISANEGRIRHLKERMEVRRAQIERAAEHSSETEHLAISLVEVTP